MRGKGKFRKVHWLVLTISAIITVLIGYYCAAGAEPNATVYIWIANMQRILQNPLQNYYNAYTLQGIGISLVIGLFIFLYYICSGKNFRFGEEQGSAALGDVKQLNKELSDPNTKKDDPENLVVTKKVWFKEIEYVINTRERAISACLHMSMNTQHTDLNNNVFIVGGSGAGKTFRWAKPNIMQMSGSYIITDPKGEIQRSSVGFLKKHDYAIKVINLLNPKQMKKSTRYNPFNYITCNDDIIKLVAMYMDATKDKDSQSGEQYWTDMAGLLLEALFYFTYYEGVEIKGVMHRDFKAVMRLANMVKVEETPQGIRKKTELDRIFDDLADRNPEHPAVLAYNKAMDGAADTVRSIISTFHSRLKRMQNDAILDLLSEDEMDIKKIGVRKTAVFCVIPDNDKTYNFVVSMLYDQMFKAMYDQADNTYGGALPVPVTFLLDEFANVALPENFLSLLSTMRSRNISSVIIIQNLAQIKKMYKDDEWESIPGNCDTVVYLGGNESSTHKWLAEMLGKETIDKRSSSETKGKQGSVSSSSDVMQRDLMYADEIRKMPRKKCLVFINGRDPILDDKIKTLKHPLWKEYVRESRKYSFDGRIERVAGGKSVAVKVRNAEDEEVKLDIYDDIEVALLKEEDKRNQEEYDEELRVANLIGSTPPEKSKKQVIELTPGELMWLAEHEEQLMKEFSDSFNNTFGKISEEENDMESELKEIASDLENKYYHTTVDPDAEYDFGTYEDEENEVGVSTDTILEGEVKAKAFGRLSKEGYSAKQIELLLPLTLSMDVKRICDIFTPEYDLSTISTMIDLLRSTK